MKRRDFLKTSAAMASAGLLGHLHPAVSCADTPKKASSSDPRYLTAYQSGSQIWLRWNNHLLTSYRAKSDQKYPYFYPLAGPASGNSLTTESSQPYPHHHSVFLGCDQVNGGNYWQDDISQGQILSTNLRLGECTETSAEIFDQCQWHRGDEKPIMRDERRFKLQVTDQGSYWIDATFKLSAVTDITIKRTNHSLFAVRAAEDITPDGGGRLLSSEDGVNAEGTFGKPADWCAFYGKRKGLPENVVEGVCLMAYPEPWKDCPWFTRDYGFMSPTPFYFMDKPWTLPAGKSVTLNYRVVAFAGTPQEADLDSIWKSYSDGGVGEI